MRKFRSDKPTIYWHHYPKSGRGYWRVSPMPGGSLDEVHRWKVAHDLVIRMNNPPSRAAILLTAQQSFTNLCATIGQHEDDFDQNEKRTIIVALVNIKKALHICAKSN